MKPNDDGGKKKFFDALAESWDKENRIQRELDKLFPLFDRLPLKPGDGVLDSGCGTGRLAPFIQRRINGGSLVQMDYSGEMLKLAAAHSAAAGVSFIQADVQHQPLREAVFDAVICFALFPHITDKSRALAEYHRILRPGGWLAIAHTMSREEMNTFHARVKGPVCWDFLPPDDEMKIMLAAAGFREISLMNQPALYLALTIK